MNGFIVLALLTSAFANETVIRDSSPPCKDIVHACGEAGYVRGLYHAGDGKDLDHQCLRPILEGQTVANVKVESELVQKCNEAQINEPSRSSHQGGRHRRS